MKKQKKAIESFKNKYLKPSNKSIVLDDVIEKSFISGQEYERKNNVKAIDKIIEQLYFIKNTKPKE